MGIPSQSFLIEAAFSLASGKDRLAAPLTIVERVEERQPLEL